MKVYVAMVNDRHIDSEPYVFTTAEAAIAYARAAAHENAHARADVEEQAVDGWLYYANYSPEDDSVWVVEKEVDAP